MKIIDTSWSKNISVNNKSHLTLNMAKERGVAISIKEVYE